MIHSNFKLHDMSEYTSVYAWFIKDICFSPYELCKHTIQYFILSTIKYKLIIILLL